MPDHRDLRTLDAEECWALLASVAVARVGVHTEGRVDVLPVNHLVHGGTVAWLSGVGTKLAVAAAEQLVAVEADEVDPATHDGWSVLVHGTARIVTDPVREQELYAQQVTPWADPDHKLLWIELADPVVSGRRVG